MKNDESSPVSGLPATVAAEGLTRCSQCGAELHCGALTGETSCWCAGLPALPVPDLNGGCLCRQCLTQALAKTQSQ